MAMPQTDIATSDRDPTAAADSPPPRSASAAETPEPPAMDMASCDRRFPGLLDSIGLLAGGANVIMQLSRMPVGYGVMESRVHSGSLFKHPLKRSRTTITYLAVALLGTVEEKQAYRQAVNRQHAQVRSAPGAKVAYNAFDPDLQRWVAACIYWGYSDTREKFRAPLPATEADAFYRISRSIGTTLQMRRDQWPVDRAAFDVYFEDGLRQAAIDEPLRAYLTAIADLKFMHPLVRLLLGRFNRFMTTGFLPQPLREQMHFDWSAVDQRRFERFLRIAGGINALMPRFIRQLPIRLVLADFRWRLRTGRSLA